MTVGRGRMVVCPLLALLALLLAAGCSKPKPRDPQQHPAMWVVQDASGAAVGWLFGTVHALPDAVEWRFPALDRAVEQADFLVVEIAGLANGAALQNLFQRMAVDEPPNQPLGERIDPAMRAVYGRLRGQSATPDAEFDAMESWAAALALAQLAQTGDSGNGVDRALLADFDAGSVVELEGAVRQFEIFDTLPEDEQRRFLNAVLAEAATGEQTSGNLAKAWQRGDVAAMRRITGGGMLADPALRETLLDRRNRAWAASITQLIAAGKRPLVAVGAGHMLGPQGLPALLRDAGYTVARVP